MMARKEILFIFIILYICIMAQLCWLGSKCPHRRACTSQPLTLTSNLKTQSTISLPRCPDTQLLIHSLSATLSPLASTWSRWWSILRPSDTSSWSSSSPGCCPSGRSLSQSYIWYEKWRKSCLKFAILFLSQSYKYYDVVWPLTYSWCCRALWWATLERSTKLTTLPCTATRRRSSTATRWRPCSHTSHLWLTALQRVHQNTLERVTVFLVILIAAGLFNAKMAATFGFIWIAARIIYSIGYYSGIPKNRVVGSFVS